MDSLKTGDRAVFETAVHDGAPTHCDFLGVYRSFLDGVRLGEAPSPEFPRGG